MTIEKPLVSIVLPTYNGEKYLSQAINSCINQTYKNIELIVVNDASTDSTPQIIESFRKSDSRIRIISNKTNKKLPESLNIGHRAAKGEFITWTSDDNLYLEQAIETLVINLKRNPEIDIVYSNFQFIDESDKTISNKLLPEHYNLINNNCIGACFLYKKNVFEKLKGYDVNLYLAEDYDFWIRASEQFKFKNIPSIEYKYRIHKLSLTETQKERITLATADTRLKNIQIFDKYPREYKIRLYSSLISHFSAHNNSQVVLKLYFKLLRLGIIPILKQLKSSYFFRFNLQNKIR